ncbi:MULTISPECIES: hypothetical protein [Elizabethkingia]|nr:MULTISPECIES: hypothetical protein [Elizabethkingia]MDX8574120.1 hypothetical protein [Elizabethkingia sp. HX WYD]
MMSIRKIIFTTITTLIIFSICTALSYHNGMAYDGDTVMGFPFYFYKKSVGFSLVSEQMDEGEHFYLLKLVMDIIFAFILALVIEKLYTIFQKRKQKHRM